MAIGQTGLFAVVSMVKNQETEIVLTNLVPKLLMKLMDVTQVFQL